MDGAGAGLCGHAIGLDRWPIGCTIPSAPPPRAPAPSQARKANEGAVISEKRKELAGKGKAEAVSDPQSSKRKWYEDKKKRQVRAAREGGWCMCLEGGCSWVCSVTTCIALGIRPSTHDLQEEELKRLGLGPEHAHRLETAETAAAIYEKTRKTPAPKGWEAFNQAALYGAYERRTAAIKPSAEEYEAAKAADPEFYRAGDSLKHGGQGAVSEAGVARMVAELNDRWAGGVRRGSKRKGEPGGCVTLPDVLGDAVMCARQC